MLEYMIEDLPEYKSRGERIMSVLNGSGSVDVLPGRPDVQASDSDFRKGESYDPPLDFDPNSFSRIDKFDGLESGQGPEGSTLVLPSRTLNLINPLS